MTTGATAFSFPALRQLQRYLGETDALVELTELAARSFIAAANQSGNVGDFVDNEAKNHGIRVNLGEVACLTRHLARNYIVTVYHAAETFFRDFRREHIALYQKTWSGDGNDIDPLTVVLKNIAVSEAEAESKIGSDLVSRFQYYRIVRNWVAHTKESDDTKPAEKFSEISIYSPINSSLFSSVAAPNPPSKLCFDDFIFFSRLTKLIAERICDVSKPPIEFWTQRWPINDFKRLATKPERMRAAVAASLRTKYGMDTGTAKWISDEICGSLA